MDYASLDYEELLTVFCDWKRIVNFRPLTYVPDNIDEDFFYVQKNSCMKLQSGVPDIHDAVKAAIFIFKY